jgi:putative transposase
VIKTQNIVETQNIASLQQSQNKFGPQSQNLASIVRGYKIGVTKFAKSIQINFAWQPRFHEHVIRNEETYLKIVEYIQNNPLKWQEDKYHV